MFDFVKNQVAWWSQRTLEMTSSAHQLYSESAADSSFAENIAL